MSEEKEIPGDEENIEEMYKDFESKLEESEEKNKDQPLEEEQAVSWDKKEEEIPASEPVESMNQTFGETDAGESEVKYPKSTTFDENPGSVDSIIREALSHEAGNISVTESDKSAYLKAVLNDVPVILPIELCKGELKVEIRSRSAWEQTCLYAAVQKDQDDGIIRDLATVIIQLQKYGCALMVLSLNGVPYSDLKLDVSESLEDCVKKLQEQKDKLVENLSIPKWSLLLNALRAYETKLSELGSSCLNENFWEPAG